MGYWYQFRLHASLLCYNNVYSKHFTNVNMYRSFRCSGPHTKLVHPPVKQLEEPSANGSRYAHDNALTHTYGHTDIWTGRGGWSMQLLMIGGRESRWTSVEIPTHIMHSLLWRSYSFGSCKTSPVGERCHFGSRVCTCACTPEMVSVRPLTAASNRWSAVFSNYVPQMERER